MNLAGAFVFPKSGHFSLSFKKGQVRPPPPAPLPVPPSSHALEKVKNPLRKGKKWKHLLRKTTAKAKQKLSHYLHQVFISYYYSKMSLFLFSLVPVVHCNPIEAYLL